MRIIKDNNRSEAEVTCCFCQSVLAIKREDVIWSCHGEAGYFKCPCCLGEVFVVWVKYLNQYRIFSFNLTKNLSKIPISKITV